MKMSPSQTELFQQLTSTILRSHIPMSDALLSVVHCLAALTRSQGVSEWQVAAMVVKAYKMPDQGVAVEQPQEKPGN